MSITMSVVTSSSLRPLNSIRASAYPAGMLTRSVMASAANE
jgi:hypothetical protein